MVNWWGVRGGVIDGPLQKKPLFQIPLSDNYEYIRNLKYKKVSTQISNAIYHKRFCKPRKESILYSRLLSVQNCIQWVSKNRNKWTLRVKNKSRDVLEFCMKNLSAKLGKRMFIIFLKMLDLIGQSGLWVEIEG